MVLKHLKKLSDGDWKAKKEAIEEIEKIIN